MDSNLVLSNLRQLVQTSDAESVLTLNSGKVWDVDKQNINIVFSNIFNKHLENFKIVCIEVLGENDPALELSKDERYSASIYGKNRKYSESLRTGLVETLVWLSINQDKLLNCSPHFCERTVILTIRSLLEKKPWQAWASINRYLHVIAEAHPTEFLNCIELALKDDPCPFEGLYDQENSGFGGDNYMTGLLWGLENLAWTEDLLARVCLILAELASKDPGGSWANRPINSLKTILLPWLPQTLANKDKRISAIKPVIRYFPNIAWQVILAMLPSTHGTSSGSHKPKWRNPIPDDFKQEVLNVDYWDEVTQYANLVIDMAEQDIAKLTQLAKEFDHLPAPAFERLNVLLASDLVRKLPEHERAKVWKNLTEYTQKHRKYSDAAWALPNDILEKIESVTRQLEPADLLLKYERLFGNNDWELFDEEAPKEKNWEVQRDKLREKRAKVIEEIYSVYGIDGIYRFIEQVETPYNVGVALADFDNGSQTPEIIPKYISSEQIILKQFASGFAVEAFCKYSWAWVNALDFSSWETDQKVSFLTCLPFDTKTNKFVKELLGADENLYWKVVFINPFQTDIDLLELTDKLLEVKRVHSAIDVLHHRLREGKGLDIQRSVKALLSINDSVDNTNQMSNYDTVELIKALQTDPNTPEDDLFRVEWFYVQLLDELHGNKPVILQKKLATEPSFFAELMRLMYRPSDAGDDYPKADEEQRILATNAWRLLQNWKLPPGLNDGVFNPDDFKSWVEAVKNQATEDNRYEISMQEIGKVFYYYPDNGNGLWLPNEVAEVIDGDDDVRIGYSLEITNSRGVHWVDPEGKPELALAEKWNQRAKTADDAGYPRFAARLRDVAESYRREAQRNIDEFASRR